jgi:hypothetical protein
MIDDLKNVAGDMLENVQDAVMGSEVVQDVLGAVKEKAAELGISSETFDEVSAKAKEILADGKVSGEEMLAQVKAFAEEKGLPTDIAEKLSGMLQK